MRSARAAQPGAVEWPGPCARSPERAHIVRRPHDPREAESPGAVTTTVPTQIEDHQGCRADRFNIGLDRVRQALQLVTGPVVEGGNLDPGGLFTDPMSEWATPTPLIGRSGPPFRGGNRGPGQSPYLIVAGDTTGGWSGDERVSMFCEKPGRRGSGAGWNTGASVRECGLVKPRADRTTVAGEDLIAGLVPAATGGDPHDPIARAILLKFREKPGPVI